MKQHNHNAVPLFFCIAISALIQTILPIAKFTDDVNLSKKTAATTNIYDIRSSNHEPITKIVMYNEFVFTSANAINGGY